MNERVFVSGNEAVALGVRLARPQVISAYPITPQTVAVERLSEMVEDGSLKTEYLHVESEHSAISAAIGASAVGARTFTATSSQGLLYMAEGLFYASGGRFPIVMMNANRALALPWNIYGDQQDSLALLNSGWIQIYVEDAQEALDMMIQAYAVAEDPRVLTPVMVNLDGFVLTHTYEPVLVPAQEDVDAFLPPYQTTNRMSFEAPTNMGFTAPPAFYTEFKIQQHRAILGSAEVIREVDQRFGEAFGRSYGGLVEAYRAEDADFLLVTLGSVTGTARLVVDRLREAGRRVGLVKLRTMRPFPREELATLCTKALAVGLLEKNISLGHEGNVFTHVKSAVPGNVLGFVAGLGGRDVSKDDITEAFNHLETSIQSPAVPASSNVIFLNPGVILDEPEQTLVP